MNLRQIIRNQKLINFNLLSLIKEEALSYEEYTSQKMPGLGNKMRKISTILQYKSDEDFSSHPKKEQLYNQALQNLQLGIESGKVKLSSVPEEFRKEGLKRKSPEPKETPQAAPDEEEADEEDFDDELKTMQGFMADEPMPDEEEADDEGDDEADDDPAEKDGEDGETDDEEAEEIAAGAPDQKNKELGEVNKEGFENPDTGVSPNQFKANMKAAKSKPIKPPVKFDDDQAEKFFGKVPAVYRTVVERLLNQSIGNGSITDFMKGVGAGQPASQAGEIITMCALTMNDAAAAEFFDMLRERVKDQPPPKDAWIDKGWIDSAQEVREGTIARYNETYGEGNWEVENGCWDSEREVEDMGMEPPYAENKGFSTDTYMRIKVNGDVLLDEISLKKNLDVNLLNKTTNALTDFAILGSDNADEYERLNREYNELETKDRTKPVGRDLKKQIDEMRESAFEKLKEKNPELAEKIGLANAERAMKDQRKFLGESIAQLSTADAVNSAKRFNENKDKGPLDEILRKLSGGGQSVEQIKEWAGEAAELVASGKLKGITFAEDEDGNAIDPLVVLRDGEVMTTDEKKELFGSSDGKKIQKKIWYATVISSVNANGTGFNKKINDQRKKIEKNVRDHTNAVIEIINDIPEMRAGMLRSIREEFPLKALFSGEEKMSLSKYNCDPKVLQEIFDGAESYEEIEDKLQVAEHPPGSGNLALVYSASDGSGFKPIASLTARSEGMGYANTYKFELKVHKGFKSALRQGNHTAYPNAEDSEGNLLYPPAERPNEYLMKIGNILSETKQNTLGHHWMKAEEDYPVHYFIREINKGSLN